MGGVGPRWESPGVPPERGAVTLPRFRLCVGIATAPLCEARALCLHTEGTTEHSLITINVMGEKNKKWQVTVIASEHSWSASWRWNNCPGVHENLARCPSHVG